MSPLARRALSIRTILVFELWTRLGCWIFVAWPAIRSAPSLDELDDVAARTTSPAPVG